ncbi:MAG: cyclic nucleotide-binding domain-containing protein [Spirochaetes bacterium]|jgi:TolA-binding protein|nr:cyclic nucleotide-binding domain-containing protein [Spirochaetota bacterium]
MASGTSADTGIISRNYKSGSIIYFEGDKSEYIYILKGGRVILTSVKLDTGEEIKEEVRQGEFFGVKSALGKYPREETAQTIGDTIVLVLNLADFEKLVLRNVNVVRKMLRVFSNQLRRIGKMQRSILGGTEEINPDVELFKVGEYYYKNGSVQHAQYAYKKYMEYYPDAQYAKLAMERIKAIAAGQPYPDASPGPSAPPPRRPVEDEDDDSGFDDDSGSRRGDDDFDSFDDEKGGSSSALVDEMDDFVSGDKKSDLQDFTFDDSDLVESLDESEGGLSVKFSKAAALAATSKFGDALKLYQDIMAAGNVKAPQEKKLQEEAQIEAGICQSKMGKMREALETLSGFIKKFPQSENVKKAIYYIAEIFDNAKQSDKAISYYNRVLNMTPKDDFSKKAMNRIKQLQNG